MKKIVLSVFLLLLLVSCGKKEEVPVAEYPYEISSKAVDMSGYKGVSSTNHNFRLVTVSELVNTIDKKSSAVFMLGRTNCGCCQDVCHYLDEVAKEMGVIVYYINVYNEDEPLSQQEMIDTLYKYLYDILGKNEKGEKVLLTPQVFAVVNGEFYASQICMDGYDIDENASDAKIEKFKDSYRHIMQPFVSKQSD